MWTKRFTLWRLALCTLLVAAALSATARGDEEVPSESQCRPYIEKALKGLESGDAETEDSAVKNDSSEVSVDEDTNEVNSAEDGGEAGDTSEDDAPSIEVAEEPYIPHTSVEEVESKPSEEEDQKDDATAEETDSDDDKTVEDSKADDDDGDSKEQASAEEQAADTDSDEEKKEDEAKDDEESKEGDEQQDEDSKEVDEQSDEPATQDDGSDEQADDDQKESTEASEETKDESDGEQSDKKSVEDDEGSQEEKAESGDDDDSKQSEEDKEETDEKSTEDKDESKEQESETAEEVDKSEVEEESAATEAETEEDKEDEKSEETAEASEADDASEEKEGAEADTDAEADASKEESAGEDESAAGEESAGEEESTDEEDEGAPEEDLLIEKEIPKNLRSREHITKILRLDEDANEDEIIIEKSADIILRDLKKLYEGSIKPLEALYKYRDLSNRHFGDPEIFSKPLVLFMGPWSGGKSSILNYITGLEFTDWSLRTGAEPSPAYFNILMHGKEPEVLDGTQLAADWTFSGLQKFGQGLEERLRGLRYPSKLLEKVNIVEIPGILEVRKQVSRVFPFNDACQWFIDRADIIFLVYDPSKLDVGPETEAILDQLKGRESQTRIVLNKADTVKPEELMRVQSALIWNISPLMSSAQPPVMYTVSLWSLPYEAGAPVRLLQAQERELFKDLRNAIDKRIENKIASARRFAVRVRNHAKMVDCYLTTYYNHKTIFGNKKLIAEAIIENPQNYHIYEGLSTLTNISRYDLPDPETYRDFFRLNSLYEFQQLSATCTYFRGCPITKLDVAIAYDLPELVGRYKKMVETATPQGMPKS
ncbi:sarcalumenin [Plutella xylostella]|uniref:sarcalumenin n=1 Tax=Plutella xylostella TaxID=51655 RepID=UPI002032E0D5|nr:sarcalumenin [Plutella xylostella]XP_048478037.1 sarcalumenin [Plutella xylostella]